MSKNKDNGIIFRTRIRGLDGQRIKAFLMKCGISDTKPSAYTIEQFTLAAVSKELRSLQDAVKKDQAKRDGVVEEEAVAEVEGE
jgi:hypothetical protein